MVMTTAQAKVRSNVPAAEIEDDAVVLSSGDAKRRRSGPRKREAWRTAKPAPVNAEE